MAQNIVIRVFYWVAIRVFMVAVRVTGRVVVIKKVWVPLMWPIVRPSDCSSFSWLMTPVWDARDRVGTSYGQKRYS